MRILICVSGNADTFDFKRHQVFVWEQIETICRIEPTICYDVFAINQKGIKGYLKNLPRLKKAIIDFKPDIIHAHCGHVGALAILQNKVPVVTTFHGSDINSIKTRPISFIAYLFSRHSIFVSKRIADKLPFKVKNYSILPCGVNRAIFKPEKATIQEKPYALFSSSFDSRIKNYPLAKAAMCHFPNIELKELKNRTRDEVATLINGAEFILMTSYTEGSPQIIKEAICCSQRIVSVDVGDVKENIKNTPGCIVCQANVQSIVKAIRFILSKPRTYIPNPGSEFDSQAIANKVIEIYKQII